MVLFRWLYAVICQWVAELTGGVMIGALALYSAMSGVSVPRKVYEIVALVCLFQAMFLAWRDEEEKRIAAEKELQTPNLRAEISQVAFGTPVNGIGLLWLT